MSEDDDDYVVTPSSARSKLQQQQQHRVSIAARVLQSPTSQNPMHFLGSNDDQLERAQARAARAAASRRKSAVAKPLGVPSSDADISKDLFGKEQVMELFQNCIKLASENKINQKNTWELGLIDHLREIITVESEDDTETNFQKASCTLEAGVKIYSLRVDSVHSEAYKVLGGINRVGREDDKENILETDETGTEQRGPTKKEKENKMSPLSTLESSFEALNVKKFDVAFTVDPLYHQTSAQFDEGGAKGLLLSNLGVYGGCKVLFDSSEVPGKSISRDPSFDNSETIDLSFAKEQIEQMVVGMLATNDIQPTLRDIVNLFDEDNKRPSNVAPSPITAPDQDDTINNINAEWEANDNGPWNFDQDDHASTIDDDASFIPPSYNGHQEVNDDYESREFDTDDRFEKIAGFLSLGLGFNSKANTWAGPDHWKYRKVKGHEQSVDHMEEPLTEKKTKNKKQGPSEIDFTKSLDRQMTDIFIAPKNTRTLLLPLNRVPCNVLLPEDCHYHPESLVKLFLLPDVMCLGKKGRKQCYDTREEDHAYDPEREWDNGSIINDHFDDAFSDTENSGDLVSQPRMVSKVEVDYDKFSKQVDVHALKEVLWDHITKTVDTPLTKYETAVPFKQVLTCFANECMIPSLEDVSPHLCFICLLHLANEHSLRICDRPTLDELDIYVPPTKPKN